MRQLLFDVGNFFFPAYCPVCGRPMQVPEEILCFNCELKMPRANYVDDPDNPVAQLFWGRTQVEEATALFRFEKGSKYQKLLHLLKYKGDIKMGNFLGRMLGSELQQTNYSQADYLVPVPLHPKREAKRGYNQSEIIARGVSQILDIPIQEKIIYRKEHTSSQTKKSRYERWENMKGVFQLCEKAEDYTGKSILLIDDVITTGSTLEACADTILQLPETKIRIATIASA